MRKGFLCFLVFARTTISITSVLMTILVPSESQQVQRSRKQQDTSLVHLWDIQVPIVTLDSDKNTVTLNYGVSEYISSFNNVRANILTPDCISGLSSSDGISMHEIVDDVEADGHHAVQVFRFDPKIISHNDKLFEYIDNGDRGTASFCLEYTLWNGPESDLNAIKVNFMESILIIYFNLTGNVGVEGFSIEAKDNGQNSVFELDKYMIFAWHCDPVTREQVWLSIIHQGDVIATCVFLEERAVANQLILDRIDEFVWTKQDSPNAPIRKQYLFKDGVQSDLAQVHREPTIWIVYSMLGADYFKTTGMVYGSGYATMGFPTERERKLEAGKGIDPAPSTSRRNMRSTSRVLQQQQQQQQQNNAQVANTNPPSVPSDEFRVTLDIVAADSDRPSLKTAGGSQRFPFPFSFHFKLLIGCLVLLLY